MENKQISRKDFLTNTSKYAVGAMVGVAGLGMVTGGKTFASQNSYTWPYPYQAIDPEKARIRAHKLYWSEKDCASGVLGGIAQLLGEAIGEPWTSFPIEVLLHGRGGGVHWGSLCGALNGAGAIISLVTDKTASTNLINEVWGWATTTNIPTDAANAANYEVIKYSGALPQNISGSPLCHISVSEWCMVAGKKVSDVERKERCARLTGDLAAKTVEVLNAHFTSTFVSTFTDPASNATCMGCHGSAVLNNVMTHMECKGCHPDAHGGIYTSVAEINDIPSDYRIDNAYPNPFNPSTNIRFAIPKTDKVRLEIYDIRGRLVSSIIDSEVMGAGTYEAKWDGRNNAGEAVASGIYLARLTTSNFMKTIKLNLIK